jgi:LmbE family N-acetylglucosaminyl deacetylase
MNTDKVQPLLLAVAAHPDDVEYTSGGSLARWIAEGWVVHLVVCTDGGKGSQNPDDNPKSVAKLRRAEQEKAAKVLGVHEVIWLGYSDGVLTQAANLVEQLAFQIRSSRPTRLLTWDAWRPYQLHSDHRAAGLASVDAVLAAGNPHFYPKQLDEELKPHRVEEAFLYGTDQPDKWVNITNTFEVKMEAIKCHLSQVDHLPELARKMSHCNKDYGAEKGYTYAEAYKVLHPFCDT